MLSSFVIIIIIFFVIIIIIHIIKKIALSPYNTSHSSFATQASNEFFFLVSSFSHSWLKRCAALCWNSKRCIFSPPVFWFFRILSPPVSWIQIHFLSTCELIFSSEKYCSTCKSPNGITSGVWEKVLERLSLNNYLN